MRTAAPSTARAPPPVSSRAAPCPARAPAARMPPTSTRTVPAATGDTVAAAAVEPSRPTAAVGGRPPTLLCTSVTAATLDAALAEIEEAAAQGATAVELRLDYLTDFDAANPHDTLTALLAAAKNASLPAVVTYRPAWEGGRYTGDEAPRLAVLKYAALLGAPYVDVEVLASPYFFGAAGPPVPPSTRVILSHHDYERTPPPDALAKLIDDMYAAGADVAKIATTAARDADAAAVLNLVATARGPAIVLAMGEAGVATRILAPKYGGHLTFGALGAGRASAPGQPTLADLVSTFRLPTMTPATAVLGVIGNPVAHSRSPALHNAALAAAGVDAVYLPFKVESLPDFLAAFDAPDWKGFSVTIPHKVAALAAASEADPGAAAIGAANTLVRLPGGGLKAYNTDASAAVGAIEARLAAEAGTPSSTTSPLAGLTVVVLGAGGAGRAVAFGAAAAGAAVVVAARRADAAAALAADVAAGVPGASARGVALEDVANGKVGGDVLANTTPVGMASSADPRPDASPVPAGVLPGYKLVFDAVYTPLDTRLLRDARAAGVATADGVEMFVRQAADQFRLFTGVEPPLDVMRGAVLASLKE